MIVFNIYRLAWLKKTTCLYLNEPDPDLFDEMLRSKNVESNIMNFFTTDISSYSLEDANKHRAAFFYRMRVEDDHLSGEEEWEEEEEELDVDMSETFEESTETEKVGKKKTKKKGGKGQKKGGKGSKSKGKKGGGSSSSSKSSKAKKPSKSSKFDKKKLFSFK